MELILNVLLSLLMVVMAVIVLAVALCGAMWVVALIYGWQTTRQEERALRQVRARKRRRAKFRRVIELMESGAPAPRFTDVR